MNTDNCLVQQLCRKAASGLDRKLCRVLVKEIPGKHRCIGALAAVIPLKLCRKQVLHPKAEILLSRRTASKKFYVKAYGLRPDCEEWLVLENLTKHVQFCDKEAKKNKRKEFGHFAFKSVKGRYSSIGFLKTAERSFHCNETTSYYRNGITRLAYYCYR